ncbi:MAG TPA: ABC transporter permease [Conexibacter sp.]|jgi:spermidine/putrescine transport system permease protein
MTAVAEPSGAPRRRSGGISLANRRRLLPWIFALPGLLWLILFFAIPLVNQANVSLQTGDPEAGYNFTWAFSTYWDALRDYHTQFLRSLLYAGVATVIDLIIAFPLAYFMAYKAGRWKNFMLLLVVLPFFMSYVLRTVSWQLILADNGWVVSRLRDVGLVSEHGRVLATGTAVIAGIAYNFLPFMVLPLYVSLERIDRRFVEAATDLYASRMTAFRKVTLPLAIPGIFAGSLLCFIPACGDYVNAALLGTPQQYMIGNVVQSKFLDVLDYPTAAALSFILMTVILIGILLYSRLLGTRNLTEVAA